MTISAHENAILAYEMMIERRADMRGHKDDDVDVSLRMGPLEDSGLVAHKIVDLRRVVCASPAYLARHGRPAEPADLVRHACLTLSRNPGSARRVCVFPRDNSQRHFGQAASWAKWEDVGVSCRRLPDRSAPPLESRCIHLARGPDP
jgi:DNA-binding transcriptional LysR family regulator